MAKIEVKKGSPSKISTEELRAMLSSASLIMEYHNHELKDNKNTIKVYLESGKRLDGKTKNGKPVRGRAFWKKRMIVLPEDLDMQDMFTTVIHEVVHLYKRFPPETTEKCTSTLVSKIKEEVAQIYDSLVEDVYKRSAYIAHTKISYESKGDDYYDKSENKNVELSKGGVKYR